MTRKGGGSGGVGAESWTDEVERNTCEFCYSISEPVHWVKIL